MNSVMTAHDMYAKMTILPTGINIYTLVVWYSFLKYDMLFGLAGAAPKLIPRHPAI